MHLTIYENQALGESVSVTVLALTGLLGPGALGPSSEPRVLEAAFSQVTLFVFFFSSSPPTPSPPPSF